ncbi:putative aminopeptidase, partial [Ascoidea rubescens DSM 1968]
NELRVIKLSEFEDPIVVTEREKLNFKRKNINFFDITELSDSEAYSSFFVSNSDSANDKGIGRPRFASFDVPDYQYPKSIAYKSEIDVVLKEVNKNNLYNNLVKFSSFYTRYYKSDNGLKSANWLKDQIVDILNLNTSKNAFVNEFHHSWPQYSTIVTIPGIYHNHKNKDKETIIIIGSHQDSTNLLFPSFLGAPGADDDGSGTITCLEVLRLIILSDLSPINTLQFHFYSAEEGGLLGSADIFNSYKSKNLKVVAMLQQDMTGYTEKTLSNNKIESMGLITDYTNDNLNQFVKLVINQFCSIPYTETKCGYACSDHGSATHFGYPSAFVIESEFEYSNPYIHSTKDTVDRLDFDHMAEFVKLTTAFAYELALTE